MGKLERARIHVLTGTTGRARRTSSSYIEVCFNPKEYSLEKSVEWDAEKAFTDAPQPEFKAPKPDVALGDAAVRYLRGAHLNVRDKWVRRDRDADDDARSSSTRTQERQQDRQEKFRPAGRSCSSGAASSSRASSSRCRRSTRCSSPTARRCGPSARSRFATSSTPTSTTIPRTRLSEAGASASRTRSSRTIGSTSIAATQLGDAAAGPRSPR